MRIAEIASDFRNLQNYISNIRINPSSREENEEGYVVLRACQREAQVLLAQPFRTENGTSRDEDEKKEHLRRYASSTF